MCDRTYSFSDVILSGGAADGGLYVPADDLPEITVGELQRLVHMNYCERALRILERLVHPSDVRPSLLRHCVHTAFNTGDSISPALYIQHLIQVSSQTARVQAVYVGTSLLVRRRRTIVPGGPDHAVGRCNCQTWPQICRIQFSCSATNYIVARRPVLRGC